MPADSQLAKFHEFVNGCATNISKSMDVHGQFKESIEKAGFVNLHKINYKPVWRVAKAESVQAHRNCHD